MAKISPIQPIGSSDKTFKDNSEQFKSHVSGAIDRVWTDIYNHEGYEMRKMRVRSERIPMIGEHLPMWNYTFCNTISNCENILCH